MRQLNFDLKTLQARHREGAFITRRDRSYALDQAANMLHALGLPIGVVLARMSVQARNEEAGVVLGTGPASLQER